MKKLLIIINSLFLFSCSTTSNHVGKDTVLKENEGILVCSIHVEESGWEFLHIFNKGDLLTSSGVIEKIDNPWDIVLMTLDEGYYTYDSLFYAPFSVFMEKKYFHVEAGKINYIGDLYIITFGDISVSPDIRMYYKDNEKLVLDRLDDEYPYLKDKYEIRKAVDEKVP